MTPAEPALPPATPAAVPAPGELEYVGFWPRVGAGLVDTLWMLLLTVPLLAAAYGWHYFTLEDMLARASASPQAGELLISYALPAACVLAFWGRRLATPGKMLIRARIVDARTGGAPSTLQFVVRLFGGALALLPAGAGLFWIAFDRRRQGWHDKLARTVVVRPRRR